MPENPLKLFETLDPELLEAIEHARKLSLTDGALHRKYKYLIAMCLDASHGASGGVKSLAQRAMQEGATKEQVIEALRVAYYICGAGVVYTAAPGFKEIFESKQ